MQATEPFDLVVRGDVVLPDRVIEGGGVAVRGERIEALLGPDGDPPAREHLGGRGLLVLPGGVDVHAHALLEPQEGTERMTRGAIAGGTTTVVDQPLDLPEPITTAARLRDKAGSVDGAAYADVALLGGVTKGSSSEVPGMVEAGAIGFKHFMVKHPLMDMADAGEMLRSFELIARHGVLASIHGEEPTISVDRTRAQQEAGRTRPEDYGASRPPIAEIAALAMVCELALETGAHVHFHHMTVERSFVIAERARADGADVTTETCLHYLLLCEDDVPELGALAKINPPLRSRAELEGLWRRVARGAVDLIGTDHAPKGLDSKRDPDIFKCGPGIPQVEVLVPLLYSEGVATGRITPGRMVSLIAANPARTFGLWPHKGSLLPGADADVVLLDPAAEWVVDGREMECFCGWSPYDGRTVNGKVVTTVLRGNVAFADGEIVSAPGSGRVIGATGAPLATAVATA